MAGNLVKPLLSLYGTEWRERGYGLWASDGHTVHIVYSVQSHAKKEKRKREHALGPVRCSWLLPFRPLSATQQDPLLFSFSLCTRSALDMLWILGERGGDE